MSSVLATTLHDFEDSREECEAYARSTMMDVEDLLNHFQTICTYYNQPEKTTVTSRVHEILTDTTVKLRHYMESVCKTFCATWKEFGDELETACYLKNSKWALNILRASKCYLDDVHSYLLDLSLDMCGSLTYVSDLIKTLWPEDMMVLPLWRSFIVWIDDRTEEMLYQQMDKIEQCIARF